MQSSPVPKPALSYAQGEASPALLDLCIAQLLDRNALRYPDLAALIMPQEKLRLTWAELHAEVERTARGFMALGFQKGERIGIWATNISQWVLMQFATAKMGAILVNLNLRFRAHELDYVLKEAGCKGLVLEQGLRDGLHLDADKIRTFCRSQVASFKIRKYIKFVDSFPTTVTGKVQKFLMRQMAIKEMRQE